MGKYISSPKFKINISIITSYGMSTFCKLFLASPSNFPNSHRVELILSTHIIIVYFPRCSVVKNLPAKTRYLGLIPRFGRVPGGGNGNPLQYSCLENPVDRGAWQATVHGVAKDSDMTWIP